MRYEAIKRTINRAMLAGPMVHTMHSPTFHEWNVSGNCQAPVERDIFSRPDLYAKAPSIRWLPDNSGKLSKGGIPAYSRHGGRGDRPPYRLILQTRCRKCDPCRRVRSHMWTERAEAETRLASRTWFGTLTLRPSALMHFKLRTIKRLRSAGAVFDDLPLGEQFIERNADISKEITLYLKRVRKESGATLRALLVTEAHASGEPHYHILIHEKSDSDRVTKRTLDTQWKHGFTKYRLVKELREARYVCKYLSKDTCARVRASLHYGQSWLSAVDTNDNPSSAYDRLSDSERNSKRELPDLHPQPESGTAPRIPDEATPSPGLPATKGRNGAASFPESAPFRTGHQALARTDQTATRSDMETLAAVRAAIASAFADSPDARRSHKASSVRAPNPGGSSDPPRGLAET